VYATRHPIVTSQLLMQVKLSMEEDYDIGHSIRTSLIPEAVLWYTGEAMEDEDDDEEDDEDFEEVRRAGPCVMNWSATVY
jgi:hypothetical protein